MIPISLCMIVRDEEALLGRCLDSVRDVVDELCVLDTGSVDGTVEIARKHGARVETFKWCNDFSAARNASIGMATCDWILVLDADEVLSDPIVARKRLIAFAKKHRDRAGQITIQNVLGGGDTSRTQVSRFFPRNADWRFDGKLHEQLLFKGEKRAPASLNIVIEHFGYSPEQMQAKRKVERNESILREMLIADPRDSYSAYQLGRTLATAGRFAEALEAFELSIESLSDDAPYVAHLFETAATCLRELGHAKQALDWLGNIEEAFRNRADTCFLIALLAMDSGDLERAKSGFEHCLTLAGTTPKGGVSWPPASTWAAEANLAMLLEHLQEPLEATKHYRAALRTNPNHEGAKAGLARLG